MAFSGDNLGCVLKACITAAWLKEHHQCQRAHSLKSPIVVAHVDTQSVVPTLMLVVGYHCVFMLWQSLFDGRGCSRQHICGRFLQDDWTSDLTFSNIQNF